MTLITIKNVQILPSNSRLFYGHAVDLPVVAYESNNYYVDIVGWVVGKKYTVLEVLATDAVGRVCARLPLNVSRPDVAQHFPQVKNVGRSGFSGSLNVIGLSLPKAEVFLCALLKNGTMVRFAQIQLERVALQLPPSGILQPLVVNSIGRTGTTWLMRLLLEHERVVGYPRYPHEARIASYWLHSVLKSQALYPTSQDELDEVNLDWMNRQLILNPKPIQWFRRAYQEQLGVFCRSSIEQAYVQLALQQGKDLEKQAQISPAPVYFVEKFGLGYVIELLWEIYPQTREIVLVRDFRDMLCSILKFTDKPENQHGFGRDKQLSEAEFIQHTAANIKLLVDGWQQRQDKAYLLRYEDLILAPEATLSKLLVYLRLDNSPAQIAQLLEKASKNNHTALQQHRTSSNVQASIGRWHTDLNDTQKALTKQYFADYLELFGYTV